jgi:hypothetical protein
VALRHVLLYKPGFDSAPLGDICLYASFHGEEPQAIVDCVAAARQDFPKLTLQNALQFQNLGLSCCAVPGRVRDSVWLVVFGFGVDQRETMLWTESRSDLHVAAYC